MKNPYQYTRENMEEVELVTKMRVLKLTLDLVDDTLRKSEGLTGATKAGFESGLEHVRECLKGAIDTLDRNEQPSPDRELKEAILDLYKVLNPDSKDE